MNHIIGEISGVYEITNKENGKKYIGSSQDIAKRFGQHVVSLLKGTHHCKALQDDFDKNGLNPFDINVIRVVSRVGDLSIVEQRCLNRVPINKRYNSNNSSSATAKISLTVSNNTYAKFRSYLNTPLLGENKEKFKSFMQESYLNYDSTRYRSVGFTTINEFFKSNGHKYEIVSGRSNNSRCWILRHLNNR